MPAVAAASLSWLTCTASFAAPPTVRDLIVTDVTPRSFSVAWTTDEPATAGIQVFVAPACIEPLANVIVVSHPTVSNNPAIRQAAELAGVMKVRVTNLAADTEYCFQTLTTSKSTSEVAVAPAVPGLVRTARGVRRVQRLQPTDPLRPFSNDLVRFPTFQADPALVAEGALIVVSAPDASAPVSGFVGDGIPAPDALVDLNNLFGGDSGESLDLRGGERLVIRQLRGLRGASLFRFREAPADEDLAEVKDPITCFFADLDCNGVVDIVDVQRQLNQLDMRAGQPGFNPDLDTDVSGVVDLADVQLTLGRFGQRKPFAP